MNINQVHTPERLLDESVVQYRQRQQLSKRLAGHTPMFHDSMRRGTYFKDGTKSAQVIGAIKRRTVNASKAMGTRHKSQDVKDLPLGASA